MMNAKKSVSSLGWLFVVVGILGFIPGVTQDGMLVGLFEVDAVHNLIHLVTGILALGFASKGTASAVGFAKIFGVIYALVAVLGLMAGGDILGIIHVNTADNLLHIVLALVFLWVGFGSKK